MIVEFRERCYGVGDGRMEGQRVDKESLYSLNPAMSEFVSNAAKSVMTRYRIRNK